MQWPQWHSKAEYVNILEQLIAVLT
jgi:hypothetical protein